MKRVFILLLTLIVLSSNDCHRRDPLCGADAHQTLTIKNNSNKRINYIFGGYYPDTTIIDVNSPLYYSKLFISPGGSSARMSGWAGCWESVFTHNTKQWICFFDEDSLEQIPWETIKATNRGVLEKRQLTLEYLKANNFVIAYP